MKKNYALLIITLALFSINSCSAFEQNDQEVVIAKNKKQLKIQMQGNPTTGYTWDYSLSQNECIYIEENVTYLGNNSKEIEIVGAPSNFEYTIKAKKDGNTELVFSYQRPWENKIPLEQKKYNIQVKNKKIYIQSDFNGEWILNDFTANKKPSTIYPVDFTLEQKEKSDLYTCYGNAGVNLFNCTVKINKNTATTSKDFALTKMMGSPDEIAFEDLYLELFSSPMNIFTYEQNGKQILVLCNPLKNLCAKYVQAKKDSAHWIISIAIAI